MIYGAHDTKATLMAKGLCEVDAEELIRFRAFLPDMATFGKKPLSAERKAEVRAYMFGEDSAAQTAAFNAALDRSLPGGQP